MSQNVNICYLFLHNFSTALLCILLCSLSSISWKLLPIYRFCTVWLPQSAQVAIAWAAETIEIYFPQVEVENPRRGCQHGWVLARTLFLAGI